MNRVNQHTKRQDSIANGLKHTSSSLGFDASSKNTERDTVSRREISGLRHDRFD